MGALPRRWSKVGLCIVFLTSLGACKATEGGDGVRLTPIPTATITATQGGPRKLQPADSAPSPSVEPTKKHEDSRHRHRRAAIGSMQEALAKIQSHLGIPVVLPHNLSGKAHVDRPRAVSGGGRWFTLHFHVGTGRDRQWVSVQYGRAMFDGCGEDTARQVTILGVPALLNSSRVQGAFSTDLIWPATHANFEGDYGLSTSYSPTETVRLAASMIAAARVRGFGSEGNC